MSNSSSQVSVVRHPKKNTGVFRFLTTDYRNLTTSFRTPDYRLLTTSFLAFLLLASPCFAASDPSDAARSISIQNNGRVKPFEAFARQTVELITGRESWNKESAVKLMIQSLNHRDTLATVPWVRIDSTELIQALGLSETRHFFSYREVRPSEEKIRSLVMSAQKKRDADARPTLLEQKAEQLYTKLMTIDALISGDIVTTVPDLNSAAWSSPYLVNSDMAKEFIAMLKHYDDKDYAAFDTAVENWNQKVYAMSDQASEQKIDLELLYYRLRPFELAAIFYFLAFLILSFTKKTGWLKNSGFGTLAAAILLHTFGIVLRVLILSRAPVSNMYESMIFMNWALMIFACVFALTQKNTFVLTAGAIISGFVMIYGNILPIDSGLEVLVPVLRSNYWLTIHVMTIVASYGAFGLALALGHRHLIWELRKKFKHSQNDESANTIYRVIQLGTLLVGVGTVLGGVWANESWGRFWGWDPKETWALITFLGYLIVIHLRHSGKLSNFWLAMSSIFGFLLVLMTWYGVNFVLGRGLHSYGQGSGGMEWVIYYLLLEAAFIVFILTKRLPRS